MSNEAHQNRHAILYPHPITILANMCGRLNVTDNPALYQLLDILGVSLEGYKPRFNRFSRAASKISIIREIAGARQMEDAIWWLLLDKTEDGFKPSKYTSFNTRYDKLNVPRSAGYHPYRQSRCIVVASGFGETEGKGNNAKYHDFTGMDEAIAFGGLYREWVQEKTGEQVISCSIITLPPHPKLKPYHSKASPLMLPKDNTLDLWLDPEFKQTEAFADLLEPKIRQPLQVQQIDKPSTYHAVGDTFVIDEDE